MSGRAFSLVAELPPFTLLYPQVDAALTSAYVTLKNSVKAYVVVYVQQANAAIPH